MKKIFLMAIATMLLSIYGCGGSDSSNDEKATQQETKPETEKVDKSSAESQEEKKEAIPETVEVVIEGNDQMKYNLDKIEVYAGQKVKLTLKHVGELPVASMGHNWVLLKKGVDKAKFAMAAMNAKENNYIPKEREKNVIVNTKMIGGGEEVTIEFDAPAKGVYDFICSFPGHYGMMNGKFIVK